MDSEKYLGPLLALCERLWVGIEHVNKTYGVSHGFIGLLVRDPSVGNIDIMHNCNKSVDVIVLLKIAIKQLEEKPFYDRS